MSDSLSQLNPADGLGLFTDGSAYSLDRSGGWAWLAFDAHDGEYATSGGASDTTNNRMEMQAWIEGLTSLHSEFGPSTVVVFSDSEYVGLGAMDRTRSRKYNIDLWDDLDQAVDLHLYVEFRHVKGHSGNRWNVQVDKLAGAARKAHKL